MGLDEGTAERSCNWNTGTTRSCGPRLRDRYAVPLSDYETLFRSRLNGTLFDDRERHRQRAGAQQDRKIGRALDREVAGNLA